MPVDKFGHTDSGSMQRVVAGGVTLTQVNNTFARLDGTNAFTGNLNLGGNSIEGLSATYTPSEDNHLTNKKYIDQHATRDYVSGMRVSPGNLVRNTTSGIIYGFEGTSGIITAAPALSPNWRPTTGAAICVLRGAPAPLIIRVARGFLAVEIMHDKLTDIVINTDSAYTTANGLITIPRTGVYRLGGFVSIDSIIHPEVPPPSGSQLAVNYTNNIDGENFMMPYGVLNNISGTTQQTYAALPYPTVFLSVGSRIGIQIKTNTSCYTIQRGGNPILGGCGLQVEFLY